MQNKLSCDDGLIQHVTHTGSAMFAIPPGAREDGYVGETLFA